MSFQERAEPEVHSERSPLLLAPELNGDDASKQALTKSPARKKAASKKPATRQTKGRPVRAVDSRIPWWNQVYFKSSSRMVEVPDSSVDVIITSPPYFNIKDYSKDGRQQASHSEKNADDVGGLVSYEDYIQAMLKVWKECERVLKPNGKLCINVPLLPMLKREMDTHHNRHIFDLQSDIQQSILRNTGLFLMDLYIWNRTNGTKKLMFGSYPNPGNFYAQNTSEFIAVFVKDGKPEKKDKVLQERSRLTKKEWVEYTQQIWNIPIPNKSDLAFGKHSAIMPEEIARRCIRLFSCEQDVVLDPFAGSGTTLKVAYENRRRYVGYELYKSYEPVIRAKLDSVK